MVRRRIGAWIIDWIIANILQLVIALVVAVAILVAGWSPESDGAQAMLTLVCICVGTAFIVTKDAWFRGRSPGKLICGYRVVDSTTGRPASFRQCVKRNLPQFVPFGMLIMLIQVNIDDASRWGDKWAGTKVVRR